MKKLILLVMLVLVGATITAQDSERLTFEFGIGGASATGDFDQGDGIGLGVYLNGRYSLRPDFQVGLEYGSAAIVTIAEQDGGGSIDATVIETYLAKAYYLPLNGFFKPFVAVGLGLGIVTVPEITVNNISTVKETSVTGLSWNSEAGFYLGGFKVGVSYTYAPKPEAESLSYTTDSGYVTYHKSEADFNATYLQYTIGWAFTF